MRILYIGQLFGTSLQRAKALESLGHEVRRVGFGVPLGLAARQLFRVAHRLRRPLDFDGTNATTRSVLAREDFDVLWIDRGLIIRPETLMHARRVRPAIGIVAYSPDDMLNPSNQSAYYLKCIPLYDLHVTTKSYNVEELRALGAREVVFVDNAYDPESHRPLDLGPEERQQFAAGVGFVGSYESERAEWMLRLAEQGLDVRIWGVGWDRFRRGHPRLRLERRVLDGLDYAKAVNATKINLGFLRKVNRDLQTTRSIEIPACGAFLLAERTGEHLNLFREGEEAEFFESFDELLGKCRHYLEHEEARLRVARAGLRRCIEGGYSNQERLRGVLELLAERLQPA